MTVSQIGQVTPPSWLRKIPMMSTQSDATIRQSWGGEFQGVTVLGDRPHVIVDRQDGCGCLIDEDNNHHSNATVLNPNAEGGRIALLFEDMVYVTEAYAITYRDDMAYPYAAAGGHRSMWWVRVVDTTEPGWYTWDAVPTRNMTNPPVGDGAQVMITSAQNVARASGRMMRVTSTRWGGDLIGTVIGDPVSNDDGQELVTIDVNGWISLAPEHQQPPTPEEWVDPMADMSHAEKIARLNTRFAALTTGARLMAVEQDWCDNYDEASEQMGLAEDDYLRKDDVEPITYELNIALTYNLSASTLDGILADRFNGSHDVRNSVDVVSYVTVTVTQDEGGEFDEDEHDIDDVLDSAGYSDYDEYNIESERQV